MQEHDIGRSAPQRGAWSGASWPLAAALLAAALGGGLGGCQRAQSADAPGAGGPPPAPVTVQTVQTARVPVTWEYVGQTAGARDAEVRPLVAGILLKRNFAEGQAVKRGQSLYTVDPRPFQVALQRAQADVAVAQARLAQATRTLARLKPLVEARAVSQREYDDAQSAEDVARADLQGAKAREAEAALNIEYTRVLAPIDGIAGRSQVSEGTLVSGAQTLLTTVTQIDPIKLRFAIADTEQMRWRAEAASGALQLPPREAFEVELRLADGSVHPQRGRLLFSDTRVSASTGTVEAEAEVPNPRGVLKPGQFVRLRLLGAARPNAVKVPARAVLEGPQGKFVYLAQGGKAVPRPVTVGEQLADGWIVGEGLASGDPLIVDGMARIFFPGAPVQVAAAGGAASAAAAGPANGGKPGQPASAPAAAASK